MATIGTFNISNQGNYHIDEVIVDDPKINEFFEITTDGVLNTKPEFSNILAMNLGDVVRFDLFNANTNPIADTYLDELDYINANGNGEVIGTTATCGFIAYTNIDNGAECVQRFMYEDTWTIVANYKWRMIGSPVFSINYGSEVDHIDNGTTYYKPAPAGIYVKVSTSSSPNTAEYDIFVGGNSGAITPVYGKASVSNESNHHIKMTTDATEFDYNSSHFNKVAFSRNFDNYTVWINGVKVLEFICNVEYNIPSSGYEGIREGLILGGYSTSYGMAAYGGLYVNWVAITRTPAVDLPSLTNPHDIPYLNTFYDTQAKFISSSGKQIDTPFRLKVNTPLTDQLFSYTKPKNHFTVSLVEVFNQGNAQVSIDAVTDGYKFNITGADNHDNLYSARYRVTFERSMYCNHAGIILQGASSGNINILGLLVSSRDNSLWDHMTTESAGFVGVSYDHLDILPGRTADFLLVAQESGDLTIGAA